MLKKIEDVIVKIEDTISVVLFLAMVGVVVWGVLCRYVLKISFLSGEELARYLMIYCVFIGTSIGVKKKTHIGVEVFVQALPNKARKKVELLGQVLSTLLFLIFFALSLVMMEQFVTMGQTTTTTNMPMYLIFSCVPIGMLLSAFHSFCMILSSRKEIEKEAV